MTHKFAKHLLLAVGAVAFTAVAANATTLCTNPPTGTLAVTGSTVCTLGGLTFSWEALSYTPTAGNLNLVTPFTGIYGADYVLDFQFSGSGGTDVRMTYEVQSTSNNITQVDSTFLPSSDTAPPPSIQEVVWGCDPNSFGCSTVLATYNNTDGSLTFSPTFGPEQTIWITKDIQTGGPVAISGFTDSVVATPEPSSIGLLLIAAFGIAFSARKLRKA